MERVSEEKTAARIPQSEEKTTPEKATENSVVKSAVRSAPKRFIRQQVSFLACNFTLIVI